jgi:PAS domain S-box-containing protein
MGARARYVSRALAFVAGLLVLAAVYFAAAKLGLALAFQAEQVTAVWPPTGIASAAVLLFGYRVWPGIALGAFLANVTTNEPVSVACGIAAGNTLEALSAALLLQQLIGFRSSLERLRDALGFVILAAAGSTSISATLGVTSLCWGGVQPWRDFSSLWWLWWLGDAAGAVLVTPLLLTWATGWKSRPASRAALEGLVLISLLVLVCLVIFSGRARPSISRHPLEYTIFPFVVWAALRFGQRGTTAVTLIGSGIALWGTVHGFGPFATGTTEEDLILLQAFMAIVAVTALLLSSAISERMRAAEAARQSDERSRRQFVELETLYRTAPVGLALVDSSLCFVRINETLAEINGVPIEKTLGRTLREVIPEIAPLVEPLYQQVFKTGKPVLRSEVHGTTPRESIVRDWVVSFYPLAGLDGSVAGVSVVVEEITERKRSERHRSARLVVTEILAQANNLKDAAPRLLQAICENLGWDMGAVWILDSEAGVLLCLEFWRAPAIEAPAFEALTRKMAFTSGVGLPGRVWRTGKPAWIRDVAADDNFPRVDAAIQDGLHGACCFPILLGGRILGVFEFFSRQAQAADPDVLETLATVGGQVGQFVGRVQAHASLQQRLAELNTLLEILPTGVWIGNRDCSKITGNPAAYEILGLPQGINASVTTAKPEMPAQLRFFANGVEVPPEDAPMQQVARSGQALRNIEHEILFPDGTRKAVYASIAPLFGEDGQVRGVIGSYADFTDRKEAERALIEADRRKTEFLATLAHELRNPLAPLANALRLLELAGPDQDMQAQARGIMERQLGHMTRLIEDLLDVSRITRNRLRLQKEPMELASAVQTALEATRPLMEELGHEVSVTLPSAKVYLDADPVRLAQVFTNLLNNAAKFTPRGGRIWLTAQNQGDEVIVSVRDTGIGVPPEHLPHLFDMFSQAIPALDRSPGGLGIGLSLVRSLVELHGGHVEARSPGLNQGSEFIVHLPSAGSMVQEMPAKSGQKETCTSGQSCRILVVDDNADSTACLSMMLELAGHEVQTARDGPEAVEKACEFRPRVILLDIGLPKMNGYEVARRIRQEPWGKDIMLVAVTGWGQFEDKKKAFEAGFDQHLTKPVDPDAFFELVGSR